MVMSYLCFVCFVWFYLFFNSLFPLAVCFVWIRLQRTCVCTYTCGMFLPVYHFVIVTSGNCNNFQIACFLNPGLLRSIELGALKCAFLVRASQPSWWRGCLVRSWGSPVQSLELTGTNQLMCNPSPGAVETGRSLGLAGLPASVSWWVPGPTEYPSFRIMTNLPAIFHTYVNPHSIFLIAVF